MEITSAFGRALAFVCAFGGEGRGFGKREGASGRNRELWGAHFSSLYKILLI